MKTYKDAITLNENSRGCYILDTVKGCSYSAKNKKGCYDNCYAADIAKRYNFDFSKTVNRNFNYDLEQLYFFDFYDTSHENKIINQIKKIDMPFVCIGEMGDPSEDWYHTVDVCKKIAAAGKPIVIITKHWNFLTGDLLEEIKKLNICINTSISALDTTQHIQNRLAQYNKLKKYCKSVLRVVSCDFNEKNKIGKDKKEIQDILFKNENVIDTVFRPNKENKLVTRNIINVEKVKFLKKECLASIYNKDAYFGNCKNCPDMCGII